LTLNLEKFARALADTQLQMADFMEYATKRKLSQDARDDLLFAMGGFAADLASIGDTLRILAETMTRVGLTNPPD
jgi:hypothetical protein